MLGTDLACGTSSGHRTPGDPAGSVLRLNLGLLFSLISLQQLQEVFRLFDNANCPSLQNKPKMFFIQACRGGECPGGPAPGYGPRAASTRSHFPVCSSQVLADPLGTSFCSLLPPPLLLCKCLPTHGVCWDSGRPWLSGGQLSACHRVRPQDALGQCLRLLC